MQVTIGNNWCTLIADAANKDEIDARVAQIKAELQETDSTYDTEKLSERIAKLAGGVAVIKVWPGHDHMLLPNLLSLPGAYALIYPEGVVLQKLMLAYLEACCWLRWCHLVQ